MSTIDSPAFETPDDIWLAARSLDNVCDRQPPFSGNNPLPYSIVNPAVYPELNTGLYWPARAMVWELYNLDMVAINVQCDDWSLSRISETYITPLEVSLGSGNALANTLILVEAASEAFERFLQSSDYYVRWQPIIRPEEWVHLKDPNSAQNDEISLGNNRLFAAPTDASTLQKSGQLTWMRKALEGYLKQFSSQFLTGELRWQPVGTAYPLLSGSADDSIIGANEGLITESLSSPRQSMWVS